MGLSSKGNGVKQTSEKWGTPAHKMQLQRVWRSDYQHGCCQEVSATAERGHPQTALQ